MYLKGNGCITSQAQSNHIHRHLWAECLENVGASMAHTPMGLHVLLLEELSVYISNSDSYRLSYNY
jgi:hypothetical protein